ncbi:caspase, EACC1-associated type [Actinacidiphila acidipaludis]|uniref:Caspase family protein n=1 Tax=Actinacidiphila acidipaludis TaxID=2873382 RepID=A0ABS7QC09_9ACTN|nr:caspase family protein [Streptomyces acidipaludis]MBY8880689.1 caspase family protein [Streptomyces acidipaludis]
MNLHSAGTRALLAGTGTHVAGSRLPDVPAVADTVRDLGSVLIDRCGLRPENLLPPIVDPHPIELGNALIDAAKQAEDVFYFHYVGHGLVSPGNKLHLATRETDHFSEGLGFKALPYAVVADALSVCRARTVVVVLDCCYSGRARGSLGTAATDAFELAPLAGAYVLSSASADELALALPGERYTSFTGALMTLLREGDPAGLPELTVEGAFRHLRRELPLRGIPAPVRFLSGQAGDLVLARNPVGANPPVTDLADTGEPLADGVCPYRGLEPFTADDARFFFGREQLTRELLDHMATCWRTGAPVAVVGLSGSGKSSLLRAGVVPAVARGELPVRGSSAWPSMVLTPGAHPLDTLATRLAGPAGVTADAIRTELGADATRLHHVVDQALRRYAGGRNAGDSRLLLVVDQFEELFTVCQDADERAHFVRAVCAAAQEHALVVLGVRADFYAHCLAYPELARVLDDSTLRVRPMDPEQLREAIQKPADAAGLALEPGLVELLLHDLRAEHDFAAGTLPLLSYALLLTWQHRHRGRTLTLAGYRATGGVWNAVTRQAETVYGALAADEKQAARMMLLRMVSLGEGTEDTRRRIDLTELVEHAPAVATARDQLARARLITVDGDTGQISHEALLRVWGRLRDWIKADRAGLLVQQELSEAAGEWLRDRRDADRLHRGDRLHRARDWAADHPDQLSPTEREFLDASVGAEQRRRRVRTGAISALALLLVLSVVATVLAYQGRNEARAQQRAAIARSLLDQADSARGNAPQLALMLGIAADRLHSDTATTASLLTGLLDPYAGTLAGHTRAVSAVAFHPDNHIVATGGADNQVIIWDGTRRLGSLRTSARVDALAFSPDGRTLAAGIADGSIALWNVTIPSRPTPLSSVSGHTATVDALVFSPDGTTLASGSADDTVVLWDTSGRMAPERITRLTSHRQPVLSAAFSRDGHTLATGDAGGTAILWDVRHRDAPAHLSTLTEQNSGGTGSLAFSPDGRRVATGDGDGTVRLWDTHNRAKPQVIARLTGGWDGPASAVRFTAGGHSVLAVGGDHRMLGWDITDPTRPIQHTLVGGAGGNLTAAVALSPDGNTLATGSADDTVILWRSGTEAGIKPTFRLGGHRDAVRAVGYRPDGRVLATGSADGTVNVWDMSDRKLPRKAAHFTAHNGWVDALAFSPDGHTLAVSGEDGTTGLWDVHVPDAPNHIGSLPAQNDAVISLAFDPKGHVLATGGDKVILWNLTDPGRPTQIASPAGHTAQIAAMAFSPDGRTLATGSYDSTTILWDVTDPAHYRRSATLSGHTNRVTTLAFSPDGRTLATGSVDTSVILWDVRDRERPRMAATPLLEHTGWVRSVAFSPDGHLLATAGNDERTLLWDVTEPAQPHLLLQSRGHAAIITAVAFSADNRTLATGGGDHLVYLDDLTEIIDARAHAVVRACSRAGRGLDRAEWDRYVPGLPYQRTCS